MADGIHHIISSPVRGGLWEFYGCVGLLLEAVVQVLAWDLIRAPLSACNTFSKEMTMKEIATYVNRTVRKPDHSTYVPSALVRCVFLPAKYIATSHCTRMSNCISLAIPLSPPC